jgi:hypothetical protein
MGTDTADSGFDMDAASDAIGASLFPDRVDESASDASPEASDGGAETTAMPPPSSSTAPPAEPTTYDVPKSWKEEMHGYWRTLDPKVQSYYLEREDQMIKGLDQYKADATYAKQLREILSPYQQTLRQLGIDDLQAVRSLFNADHQLRYAPSDQKRAYFERLAQNYGITLTPPTNGNGTNGSQPPVDPTVKAIEDKLQQMEQFLAANQKASQEAAMEKTAKEVNAFAADPAHPHFDAVADDIATLVKAGLSLQEAYDRAVWMNPVVREQQLQDRLKAETEKLKENARLEALPKQKAKAVNVKSTDTTRTPTAPLGSMEDTMKATLAELKTRAS